LKILFYFRSSTDSVVTAKHKPEEDSTHNSAMTHAGNVFVPRNLDLLTVKMDFQDSWWTMSTYVQIGDSLCIAFLNIAWKNKRR